jgi:site-specific DNA-cytosine methylase
MRPRLVSLFSGLGGWDLGAERAGLVPALAVDVDRYACALYGRNFPETPLWRADARLLTGDMLTRATGGSVDVLHASPPCQPYSQAGSRRGADDPRDMVPTWLRLVAQTRPRFVTMENVPGLAEWEGGRRLGEILASLARLGYGAVWKVLDAVDYGVAQRRRRLVLVAGAPRALAEFRWPEPTHADPVRLGPLAPPTLRPWASAWDAIGDLLTARLGKDLAMGKAPLDLTPEALRCEGRLVLERNLLQGGHGTGSPLTAPSIAVLAAQPPTLVYRPHRPTPSPRRVRPWQRVPPRQPRLFTLPGDQDPTARRQRALPSYTIADRALYARRLTARECARLQGIADDYDLAPVSEHRAKIAVGNAVPPQLAEAVVRAVLWADARSREGTAALAPVAEA